jgi:hypothetical protein
VELPHWFEFVATLLGGWLAGVFSMAMLMAKWIRQVEIAAEAARSGLAERVTVVERLIGLDSEDGIRGQIERLIETEHRRYNRLTRGLIQLGAAAHIDLSAIFEVTE